MRIRLIIALAAALAATPAAADVTAHYVVGDGANAAPAMSIEVNDRGDSRVSMGNRAAVITLDGVTYLVMADLGGVYVARQDDLLAVTIENARAMMGRDFHPPAHPQPAATADTHPLSVVQAGAETVGGRTGTVFELRDANARPGVHGLDFVVSTDADLAPVGRLLASQNRASHDGLRQMIGSDVTDSSGFFSGIAAIFERGTVIRMGRIMRLASVDREPLPAADFALPSPPLTREQLAARIRGPAPH